MADGACVFRAVPRLECLLFLSFVQVPPASAKQHGVNLNTASTPFQQASGYGQHGYGAGMLTAVLFT